jgi:hypothetical protein
VLRVGSPGSAVGLRFVGVGAGVTSPAGVGAGDELGVCGKACSPVFGEKVGVGAGDESGVWGKACSSVSGEEAGVGACGPAIGVETGNAAGTCPPSGNAEIAVKHPTAIKRLLTGKNLLVGILIQ